MKLKYYFNRKGLILVQQFSKKKNWKNITKSLKKFNYGCHQREVHVGLPTLEIKQLL
jgi:hypothetical protein